MVSTFGRAQGAALRKGFKDDIDTYLLISGMYFLYLEYNQNDFDYILNCKIVFLVITIKSVTKISHLNFRAKNEPNCICSFEQFLARKFKYF